MQIKLYADFHDENKLKQIIHGVMTVVGYVEDWKAPLCMGEKGCDNCWNESIEMKLKVARDRKTQSGVQCDVQPKQYGGKAAERDINKTGVQ